MLYVRAQNGVEHGDRLAALLQCLDVGQSSGDVGSGHGLRIPRSWVAANRASVFADSSQS